MPPPGASAPGHLAPRARGSAGDGADAASVRNAKIREVAREASPSRVHAVHPGGRGPLLGPAIELADRVLFALRQDLHGSVSAVLHPTRNPEPSRLSLRRRAKVGALNAAPDD